MSKVVKEMSRQLIRHQERFFQALGQHNIPGLRWLLEGFNFYDTERVKEVGPDRAAAEWIVRCGGSVKFDKIEDVFEDYNALIRRTAELDPRLPQDDVRVTHIYAIDASVTGYGMRHFNFLRGIREAQFIRCKNLHDFGLEYLGKAVGNRLECLQIESCPRITEFGLEHLKLCSNLSSLLLYDLPAVRGRAKVIDGLKRALPHTEIHYPKN